MNFENIGTQKVREAVKDLMTEVEKNNNVKTIFGDAVHEKDLTIIPVASICMKGGGGGGGQDGEKTDDSKSPKCGQGSGIGLGYARKVQPLGYIEVSNDKAVFKPIVDVGKIAMVFVGASVLGACMVARAILKKKTV